MRIFVLLMVVVGSLALGGGCGSTAALCGAGTEKRDICLRCGPAGGCAETAACAKTCASSNDCDSKLPCTDGVCQVVGCI
jgi:hypothetical protein